MTPIALEAKEIVMQFPQQQGWKTLLKPRPGKIALDHVNLSVNEGDIFGVLGPNGAGKTTLIKVLCTLAIPTSGSATVLGLDAVKDSLRLRKRLGVVYGDERTFFWRLSALENLMFYGSLYGLSSREARGRAYEALELVGLSHAVDQRMHHYSSGMRQRTSIARGLMNNPDLLVMDEPTRALDPVSSREIRQLVKDRVADGHRTVLIATNIMAEAEFLCDRLAFINHGAVQMTGSIEEMRHLLESEDVYEVVVSGFDRGYLDDLRRIAGVVSATIEPSESAREVVRLEIDRGTLVIPDALRIIVASGADVWSCSRLELSVDEMFAALARRTSVQTPTQRQREAVA